MLRPGEVVIHEGNWQQYAQDQIINGQRLARGLIPRDFSTHPQGFYAAAPALAVDFPLIPQSEWSQRIKDKIAAKSQLSDVRLTGNNGKVIPSRDQNGKGYCLPPGTPILMAGGGYRKIEEIQVGDRVVGNSGQPRRVLQTMSRLYSGDMITLRPAGAERPLVLTADHKVAIPSITDTIQRPHWIEAGDVSPVYTVYLRGEKTGIRSMSRKEVRDVRVYDIGVEEDHSFYANDVLVHNCWMHSGTGGLILLRARDHQPYEDLSAYGPACMIKQFKDEGGWGALGVDWLRDKGCPTSKTWPQQSMSRSNDNAATWAEAAHYRITDGFWDLNASQYDRKLTFQQEATLLLQDVPVVTDYNWWGHSVVTMDLVDGTSTYGTVRDERSGKLLKGKAFAVFWATEDEVTGGYAVRIWNSWGDSWSDRGMGVLTGSKAISDSAVAPQVALAAA